jgi:predicted nucleic acid-binding protein
VRFWDASALVPLAVKEPTTPEMEGMLEEDPDVIVWTLTSVEIASAIYRRWHVDHNEASRELSEALMGELTTRWKEVAEVAPVAARAIELLRRHSLRAADALQLAAAQIAAEDGPLLPSVTLDSRLAAAARAEGFSVLP